MMMKLNVIMRFIIHLLPPKDSDIDKIENDPAKSVLADAYDIVLNGFQNWVEVHNVSTNKNYKKEPLEH